MNKKERHIAVELFCGVGGMSLGFSDAGFRVAAAIDSSIINVDLHKQNFPETASICADISMIHGHDIRSRAGLDEVNIAVVFGGPPCQGFSIGGARDAGDPRNGLILEFARIVTELQPMYFVMENVGGLLQPQYQPMLAKFKNKLRRHGFACVLPVQRLNAADFGVPQRRKRAFILGYRSDVAPPTYPTPGRAKHVTVGEAIDDLLCVEDAVIDENGCFAGALGPASPYAKMLRRANRGPLTGFTRTEHSDATRERFRNVPPGGVDRTSRFIRLSRAGVAPTLRAGTGFENGRFMAPRPIHPDFPRCINLREAARLHSYPDWFRFHQTKWHGFMQIGNSVPPLLAKAVAQQVMRSVSASESRR